MIHYRTLNEYTAEYQNIFDTRDSESMTRLFSATQSQMTAELTLLWGDLFVNVHSTGDNTADIANLRLKTSLVYNMMLDKYTKMQSLFSIEYAPLENYNMVESGTTSSTGTGEGTTEVADSGTISNNTTDNSTGEHTTAVTGTNTETRNLETTLTSTSEDETTGTDTTTRNTTDATTYNTLDTTANTDVVTNNTTDTLTHGLTSVTSGISTSSSENTTTDKVAPFDTEQFFNDNQSTSGTTNSGTDSNTVTNSGNDTTAHTGTITTNTNGTAARTGTDTVTHTGNDTNNNHSITETTKTDSGSNTGSVENSTISNTNDRDLQSRVTAITGSTSTETTTTYSDSKEENGSHTLTRRGNIGVTTAQQMLESELELIPKKQVKFEFYNDLKRLILIGLYF